MAAEDAAFAALKAERNKGDRADPERLAELEAAFDGRQGRGARVRRQQRVRRDRRAERRRRHERLHLDRLHPVLLQLPEQPPGAVGLSRGRAHVRPVLREFYTEKDGPVTEERRMRDGQQPHRQAVSWSSSRTWPSMANGYHHSTIGYMSDLNNITRAGLPGLSTTSTTSARTSPWPWWATSTATEVEEVRRASTSPASPAGESEEMETFEPEQLGEKRLVLKQDAQPMLLMGYKIAGHQPPRLAGLPGHRRHPGPGPHQPPLHRAVKQDKKAVQCAAFAGYPGMRYRNLLTVLGIPAKDVTAAELEDIVLEEIDRLVDERRHRRRSWRASSAAPRPTSCAASRATTAWPASSP